MKITSSLEQFRSPDNSPLSLEEIRIKLGLLPWDEFAVAAQKSVADSSNIPDDYKLEHIRDNRATGRTTKMLVEALHKNQFCTVKIKAFDPRFEDELFSQAKSMCLRLNLDSSNILRTRDKGDSSTVVFHDHYIPFRPMLQHKRIQ